MDTFHRADQLHYHETSIVPCGKNSKYHAVTDNLICTKNVDGFDLSYGGGGNPLVANGVLRGIASTSSGSVNIYTSVFAHKKWIEDNAV